MGLTSNEHERFLRALLLPPSAMSTEATAGDYATVRAPIMRAHWASRMSQNYAPQDFISVMPGDVIRRAVKHLNIPYAEITKAINHGNYNKICSEQGWLEGSRRTLVKLILDKFPSNEAARLFFLDCAEQIMKEGDTEQPAHAPRTDIEVSSEMVSLNTMFSRNPKLYPWFDSVIRAKSVDGVMSLIVHVKDTASARVSLEPLCEGGYYKKIPIYLWHDGWIHKVNGRSPDNYQAMPYRETVAIVPVPKEEAEAPTSVRHVVVTHAPNTEIKPPPPLDPKELRRRISEIVKRDIVPLFNGMQNMAWYAVYDAYFEAHGVDPYHEGKKQNMTGLAYLEKKEHMKEMYMIVQQYAKEYGNGEEKSNQSPDAFDSHGSGSSSDAA